MEYVEGKSVKNVLEEAGSIPWKLSMNIIQQVGEALDYAWKQAQIVHRDIKPDNIMLTTRGSAKLADLGLARVGGEAPGEDDEFVGTPQYISPEAVLGEPIDCRSDIYSLGATLFHMICGRFPFEGRTIAEIARKHLSEPTPDVRQLQADVPEEVVRIINKMMEKKPEDRYKDAEEMLTDIDVADIGFVLQK